VLRLHWLSACARRSTAECICLQHAIFVLMYRQAQQTNTQSTRCVLTTQALSRAVHTISCVTSTRLLQLISITNNSVLTKSISIVNSVHCSVSTYLCSSIINSSSTDNNDWYSRLLHQITCSNSTHDFKTITLWQSQIEQYQIIVCVISITVLYGIVYKVCMCSVSVFK
jgi:hypothetical protein